MIKRILYFGMMLFATFYPSLTAYAQTFNDELKALYQDAAFYDPASTGCPSGEPAGAPVISGTSFSAEVYGATKTLPVEWVPILAQAGQKFDIDPSILAALLGNETGWTPASDFLNNPHRNSASATGPFQFIDLTATSYMPAPDPHTAITDPARYTSASVKQFNNGSDLDTDGKYLMDGNKDGKVDRANPYDAAYMASIFMKSLGANLTTPLGNPGDYAIPSKAYGAALTTRLIGAYFNQGPNFSAPNAKTAADVNALARGGNNVAKYMDQMMNITDAGRKSGVFGSVPTPSLGTGECATVCSAAATGGKTVVLDPGHVVNPVRGVTDGETGVDISEDSRPGNNETKNAWDIAQSAKSQLEGLGFSVILTKDTYEDNQVSLRSRAEVANTASAALAISIHTTGTNGPDAGNTVHYQKTGQGINSKAKVQEVVGNTTTRWSQLSAAQKQTLSSPFEFIFNDANIEQLSKVAGQVMVDKMKAAGISNSVSLQTEANSTKGNMWVTQYFSKVPWIYGEVGSADGEATNNIGEDRKVKYATAVVETVKQVLGESGGNPSAGCGNGAVQGNIVQTALNFAWTKKEEADAIIAADRQADIKTDCTMRGDTQTCGQQKYDAGAKIGEKDAKPAFVTAVKEFNAGNSKDSQGWPYSDCGVFVATVMRASGADPSYPLRTTSYAQLPYIKDPANGYSTTPFTDTSQLQPGDILIKKGHTAIYVGPTGQGNDADVVDSSWGEKTPAMTWKSSSYLNETNPNVEDETETYYIARKI